MKRRIACAVMTMLAVGLVSCGGGGSSPSTPNPSSPITKGILLVSQTGNGLYGITPAGQYRLKLPIEVKAINEIALNLNYARLTYYDAGGGEIQRVEVTASEIIAQAGTNHVTRDRALAFTLVFQHRLFSQPWVNATVLLNATDANGNNLDTSLIRADFRYVPDPELY